MNDCKNCRIKNQKIVTVNTNKTYCDYCIDGHLFEPKGNEK